jgi:hypothetical protein
MDCRQMNVLETIPLFECPLPDAVEDELDSNEICVFNDTSVNAFCWDNPEWLPLFKQWAIDAYGLEACRQYTHFALYGN